MRRLAAAGAVVGLVVLSLVALPSSPAGAALISGTTLASGHHGSCNIGYHGMDALAHTEGYRVDVVCNGVIPADATFTGLGSFPVPYAGGSHTWDAAVPGPGFALGYNAACGTPDSNGTLFSASENPPAAACATVVTNPYQMQVLRWVEYGAPFTATATPRGYLAGSPTATSWKALRFRVEVFMLTYTPDGGGTPIARGGRAWSGDLDESSTAFVPSPGWPIIGSLQVDSYFVRVAFQAPSLSRSDFQMWARTTSPLTNEGAGQNTAPPVPADYFTGGSDQPGGPCQKTAWIGPAANTEYRAGVEYSYQISYAGGADTIKWAWNDGGDPTWIDIPATGSPQTIRLQARATGEWVPTIHCVSGETEITWGNYQNIDEAVIDGGGELALCFDGTGIGLNPTSWVPAVGRVTGCLLRVLFVPDGSGTAAFQDAVDSSVIDAAGGIQATLTGAWGAMSDAAETHAGDCEGPAVDLPIEALDNPRIALLSTCTAPASTFAPIVRGFVLFGLGVLVILAALRGLGRVVGHDGGV